MAEERRSREGRSEPSTRIADTLGVDLAPGAPANLSSPPQAAGPPPLAGRYDILSLLGAGGMGTVYRARDTELDEIVALKMVRRELLQDATVLARFRQEVKLTRRVSHTNVARMFDISEHEGHRFLTMEFIDGEALGAVLSRRGRLPFAEVVTITEAICAGLAAVHGAGIVHRDLKPANVLIAETGRVALTDFGIARALGEAGAAMTNGALVGTPAYMAPEQVNGSSAVDARTDIYALGVLLYELLTGERPWRGDTAFAVVARRLVEPPPDPRLRHADLPDAIVQTTMRCMARLPADRFASVSEVADMLLGTTRPAVIGLPSTLGDPSLGSRTPGRREKAVAVLPFHNGGPSEDEYLADGLVDDLIDNLSMTPGLKVSSRGVVMAHKGVAQDPRELGRSLGVQVIVEGAIRRAGDHLRVSARVVSVADGFQLWARRFDFQAGAFLKVSDAIVLAVAQALTVRGQGPARDGPADASAVDLYLRARHAYHREGVARTEAVELFQRALERSPDDAMILSGYAMALASRFADASALDTDCVLGKDAAERALAASPHLGEARVALASCMLSMGDPLGAAREAQRALGSSPGLGDAHDLCGSLLMEAGALEEGIVRLRSALALEPGREHTSLNLAYALELLGRHEEVDALFVQALAVPDISFSCWMRRARIALWRRERERARGWLKALSADAKSPRSVVMLLHVVAEGRLPEEMQQLLESAVVRLASPRRRAFFSGLRAEMCAFLGDVEGVFKAFDDADAAESFALATLERCPVFDPFRADPRYAPLHARVAARAATVLEPLRASS